MNDDILVEDMGLAVDRHEKDISDRAEEVDDEDVRLDKVFGYKAIPLKDQKYIGRFLAEIEAKYGVKGPAALVAHARATLDAA